MENGSSGGASFGERDPDGVCEAEKTASIGASWKDEHDGRRRARGRRSAQAKENDPGFDLRWIILKDQRLRSDY